ncbi:MAG: NUDIX domain-containing protein [Planctomycetota bacterium]
MPVKPSYCAHCGQAVTTRVIEDRLRVVCSACNTIYYENPLPVAAAVVLNEQREVLLVKRRREPHKGMWCLPMGFAEVGETVVEAALRELREEAGIEGHVVRLLDADSLDDPHYGELLIVSFEVEKTGGAEQAGDDAEEIKYFPFEQHPQLAFRSNEKALQYCLAAHHDNWAIHDSFITLQNEEDAAMLSDSLVALIEERAAEVALQWLAEVRTNPTTQSYRKVEPELLLERATAALSQFGRWLKGDEAPNALRDFYLVLARERRALGFKSYEVLSAITLLKKYLWRISTAPGRHFQPIDVYRVLELNRRIAIFFDKALYHTQRGFEGDI